VQNSRKIDPDLLEILDEPKDDTMCVLLCFSLVGLLGQETVRLEERLVPGQCFAVSSRSDVNGQLTLPAQGKDPAKSVRVVAASSVEYDERILKLEKLDARSVRLYRRLDYQRELGDQRQSSTLRAEVARLVLLKRGRAESAFSPDGPMTWAELERIRADVFTPALVGLLPQKEVQVGDRWTATTTAVEELTDLEEMRNPEMECTLERLLDQAGRKVAQVRFRGTVSGKNEDGPNRQRVEGTLLFDTKSQCISYLSIQGTSTMLDKEGKPAGEVMGRFVLTRQPVSPQTLEDDQIRFTTEPNADNTQLLYSEPSLGVRFLYARRWLIRKADARQIVMDEPGGGGLLITLEPPQMTPSGFQFQNEVGGWLEKQKARIHRAHPLRNLRAVPEPLEHFRFDTELEKTEVVLDYYVTRQAAGGAVFAGRYPSRNAADLQREVEQIARTIRLIPPKK
jgi:hypothetical protein